MLTGVSRVELKFIDGKIFYPNPGDADIGLENLVFGRPAPFMRLGRFCFAKHEEALHDGFFALSGSEQLSN
jgi:hypothetical protein